MLGLDIVYLPEFEKKFKNISLDKVFLLEEMSKNKSKESLAGIFAAKEAFFKALGTKENWLDVWVEKKPTGRPELKSIHIPSNQKALVSISHAGDYAVAIVVLFPKI